jgi:hypothetical protein
MKLVEINGHKLQNALWKINNNNLGHNLIKEVQMPPFLTQGVKPDI